MDVGSVGGGEDVEFEDWRGGGVEGCDEGVVGGLGGGGVWRGHYWGLVDEGCCVGLSSLTGFGGLEYPTALHILVCASRHRLQVVRNHAFSTFRSVCAPGRHTSR